MRRPERSDERGVVLVLVALTMVAILIIAALVLDLSLVRNTRQANKSDADFAVTAGIHGLESSDGLPKPWAGVCSALTYLRANRPELTNVTLTYANGAGSAISGDPCATPAFLSQSCAPTDLTTWARLRVAASGDDGSVTYDIHSGYRTGSSSGFAEDTNTYSGDDGSTEWQGCDQLAVIVTENDSVYFGGVVSSEPHQTVVRSVGRVSIGSINTEVVALLLLEQSSCNALATQGNNTFVRVRSTPIDSPIRPGLIHTNSNGSTDCSGSSRVLSGSSQCYAVSSCGGPGPSIVAESALGAPGRIGVRAAATAPGVASTQSCSDPAFPTANCTIAPVPADRGLITRSAVDERFLVRIRDLKSTAATETGRNALSAANAGYVVFNNCDALPIDAAGRVTSTTAGSARIFINGICTAPSSLVLDTSITDFVVSGSLTIGSGRLLEAMNVRRFYVRSNVSVSGTLRVNRGTSSNCTDRTRDNPTLVTEFVASTGTFSGGAQAVVSLCSTFVFLADGPLPTSNGTPPANNSNGGRISLGAQTSLDWTAPNQSSALLDNTASEYDRFEDLALWTEHSGNCTDGNASGIGGQGAVVATGVFFLPNACPFSLSGGGAGAVINADAQFIVRRLSLSGTVALTMAPNPNNAIPTPKFESFGLVR